MGNTLDTAFIILLFGSGLSGLLAIVVFIILMFIKDTNKRAAIKKLLKTSIIICIISFCIGFGLCTYSLQTTSWN